MGEKKAGVWIRAVNAMFMCAIWRKGLPSGTYRYPGSLVLLKRWKESEWQSVYQNKDSLLCVRRDFMFLEIHTCRQPVVIYPYTSS